jgi:hypothetical protein
MASGRGASSSTSARSSRISFASRRTIRQRAGDHFGPSDEIRYIPTFKPQSIALSSRIESTRRVQEGLISPDYVTGHRGWHSAQINAALKLACSLTLYSGENRPGQLRLSRPASILKCGDPSREILQCGSGSSARDDKLTVRRLRATEFSRTCGQMGIAGVGAENLEL